MGVDAQSSGVLEAAWWAQGDTPPRPGCLVEPLIDGRAAMYAMCRAFLSAKQYILLAGWDIAADLPMVRGDDLRLGAEDSAQQRSLLVYLREAGLDDEALALWNAGNVRVVDVLGFAARRGVRVGVLLWDAFNFASHLTNDPARQREQLVAVGVDCLLDDSSRGITHLVQSLHQKCAVIDGRVAFAGGIDLTVQYGGDYDRWDTHQHPCSSPERSSSRSAAAHPWHDVHTKVYGPVVADVLANIAQRWAEVAARQHGPDWPARLPQVPPAPIAGGVTAQIARTIPPHTYDFAPQGIATIKDLYLHALAQARSYVYLENQYLWTDVFVGLDSMLWGERSRESMEVFEAIGQALGRGVHVAITLPDHPNVGRRYTDGGVNRLRDYAAQANAATRLHLFTLGNAEQGQASSGDMLYRPVYAHAKIAVIDDLWWTVGSANLNSRGVHSDAELNVAVLDARTARELRLALWTEHLRRPPGHHSDLLDPVAGLALLDQMASDNLARVGSQQPLDGHVLPYLTEDDGKRLGVSVDHEQGLLDSLTGGAGALPPEHAGRYL